jgi:hypothetical protein
LKKDGRGGPAGIEALRIKEFEALRKYFLKSSVLNSSN